MSSNVFWPVAWHILMVALDPWRGREAGHPIRTDLAEAVPVAEPGIDWIRYSRVHDELSASAVNSFELTLTFTDAKKLIIQLLAAVKMHNRLSFAKKELYCFFLQHSQSLHSCPWLFHRCCGQDYFFLIFPTNLSHGRDSNPHQHRCHEPGLFEGCSIDLVTAQWQIVP